MAGEHRGSRIVDSREFSSPSSALHPLSSFHAELPLLRSTEQAEAYGRGLRRVIGPDEFQTLVRTWIITELAARETHDAGAKVLLATKCQLLREAVQAFLFPDGSVSREEVSIEAFMEVAQV